MPLTAVHVCARSKWHTVNHGSSTNHRAWSACGGICPPSAPPPASPPKPPSTPCRTVSVSLWNPSESWAGVKLVLDGVEADIQIAGAVGQYGACLYEGCYQFSISGSPLP